MGMVMAPAIVEFVELAASLWKKIYKYFCLHFVVSAFKVELN